MAGVRGKSQGVADPGADHLDDHEAPNQREGTGQHALVVVCVSGDGAGSAIHGLSIALVRVLYASRLPPRYDDDEAT